MKPGSVLYRLDEKTQQAAIQRLWARMTLKFGERWAAKYPPAVQSRWLQALGAFTLTDLKRGIERIENETDAAVPTLSEFSRACLMLTPGEIVAVQQEQASRVSDVARNEMAKAREILKKGVLPDLPYSKGDRLSDQQ